MKRLLSLTFIFLLSLPVMTINAQKNTKLTFETIYRPVYGYLIDSLTNTPYQNVSVYAFDSIDDARLGEDALMKSRNPMKIKLKGDVVETRTDESGRYMVPARSTGALIFHLKECKEIIVVEIDGRSEISRGRHVERSVPDYDISELLGKDYRREPGKIRRKGPEGVVLDMDFKAYIPQPGDKGKGSRVWVERRVVDMETGEVLSSTVPVVRDGKAFHKQRKKMISKEMLKDSLYNIAENNPVLSDTTSSIRVLDHMDTESWKDRPFRLGYHVSIENADGVKPLDTLYMMTNRVNTPLKYLEYELEPYGWEPEESTEQRRAVTRRLVLEGEYDGQVPEVLKDSSYVLRELHVKAVVAQDRLYDQCIALADSMVAEVMGELRIAFAGKLNDNVRITKTSQVSSDSSYRSNVSYRYIFSTGRQFSRNDYMLQIRRAKDETRVERLCRQAMEERMILEGTSWDFAANVLAALYLRQGRPDASLLVPFIDESMGRCDVKAEDPVTFEEMILNRSEIVANQVLMLMRTCDFEAAASLASMLPEEYESLREMALCKAGKLPSYDASMNLLRQSSARNSVLIDMLTDNVSEKTLETLDNMPQDEAMTLFLRARAYCMMYSNESWEMQNAKIESSGQSVYNHVLDCLRKCFATDSSMIPTAKFDSEINEYALKEVLGVFVL